MSPLGLESAGIARLREASSPLGSIEFRRLSPERIPSPSPGCGYRDIYVALQYEIVNLPENSKVFCIAVRKI
jgi:hypothetical protein